MVADPGHRQVGENGVLWTQVVEFAAALRRGDEGEMRLADALGPAGRSGSVEHDADVAGFAPCNLAVQEFRPLPVVNAAHFHDLIEALEFGLDIVAQAARIVVEDVAQGRALAHDLQHLVHLFLVFDDGEPDLGILKHESHLCRNGVLVQGDRHAAKSLGRRHRPVKPGAVIADDGQMVAALEAQFGQSAGQGADFLCLLRPGPGLPDAKILLARGGPLAAHPSVMQQKTWKRIESGLFEQGIRYGHLRYSSHTASKSGLP